MGLEWWAHQDAPAEGTGIAVDTLQQVWERMKRHSSPAPCIDIVSPLEYYDRMRHAHPEDPRWESLYRERRQSIIKDRLKTGYGPARFGPLSRLP